MSDCFFSQSSSPRSPSPSPSFTVARFSLRNPAAPPPQCLWLSITVHNPSAQDWAGDSHWPSLRYRSSQRKESTHYLSSWIFVIQYLWANKTILFALNWCELFSNHMHLKRSWIICVPSFISLEPHLLISFFPQPAMHTTFQQNLTNDFFVLSFSNIYLKYISMLDSGSSEYWSILFKQYFLNLSNHKTLLRGRILVKEQISVSRRTKPTQSDYLRKRANNLYFLTSITSQSYNKVNLGNAALRQHLS